jgi:hypothetical protein
LIEQPSHAPCAQRSQRRLRVLLQSEHRLLGQALRGAIDGRVALEEISLELLRAQFPVAKGIRLLGISLSALSSSAAVAAEQLPLGL